MALVGVAELARALKRDTAAVYYHVRMGHITRRPDGLFDLETAIAEWEAATQHERGHNNRTNIVEIQPAPDLPLDNERPAKSSDYAKARAAVQIFEARLKKLRYEEKAKNLVPARDVEDAAYRAISCLREACMNIPARTAAALAAETDQARVYAILEAEIIAIFTDYAEGRIA
jgi:hypothetical protein